jgi:hypothetical protein
MERTSRFALPLIACRLDPDKAAATCAHSASTGRWDHADEITSAVRAFHIGQPTPGLAMRRFSELVSGCSLAAGVGRLAYPGSA